MHDSSHDPASPSGYAGWRRLHLSASWIVTAIGITHCVMTAFAFRTWSADSVWFLGAGLAVVLIGLLNLVHIGIQPCRMPTVRFVRAANWVFTVFGASALLAVPEPQAIALVTGLMVQSLASRVTMPGP
jgi:hypothetical protein